MKYLLVLIVVAVAIWLWRRNRREEMEEQAQAARRAGPAAPLGAPQAMLRCAHCGLHLPAADAIAGPDGRVYCSPAHRQADV